MKTNHEQIINRNLLSGQRRQKEKGNALIYVLVAIVLFAALSFTLTRQTDTTEANILSDEKAELLATQLISYAAQAKSALDQMQFQGTRIDDMNFIRPEAAGFDTEPPRNIFKVYHPDGGGIIPATLADEAKLQVWPTPSPDWYMGRFSNVEWTKGTADDVILIAYQIQRKVCERINRKITGNTTIPQLDRAIADYFLSTGAGHDFVASSCAACVSHFSLCVLNNTGNGYGFYNIIADQ